MKTPVKIFLTFVMFSAGGALHTMGAAGCYITTVPQPNGISLMQQQDSLNQPGNKPQLRKAYPPVNPGQPRPDRVNPAGAGKPSVTPADTTRRQQAPQRPKAKLAGEQSKPQ